MTPLGAFGACIERARHLLLLYELLYDRRQRRIRSDWRHRFIKLMRWPEDEKITRIDGKNSILILRESVGLDNKHFKEDYLSELLRASIVTAVSALDRYFHDIVVYYSWSLLRRKEEKIPKKLRQLPVPAYDVRKALETQRKNMQSRPGNAIKKILQQHLHDSYTFQSSRRIAEAGNGLLGICDFLEKVAESMDPARDAGGLRKDLDRIVKRRNQIVHEGDLTLTTRNKATVRRVRKEWAVHAVDCIECFVRAADAVIKREISKGEAA